MENQAQNDIVHVEKKKQYICKSLMKEQLVKNLYKIKAYEKLLNFGLEEGNHILYDGPNVVELDLKTPCIVFSNMHTGYRLDIKSVPIKLFDYKYKIRLEIDIIGYLQIDIVDFMKFVNEVIKKRLNKNVILDLEPSKYNSFLLERCEPIIKRAYLDVIREEEISVLESIKNFSKLNVFISKDINAYFKDFGLEVHFVTENIIVHQTDELKQLNAYMIEANRMKKLKYNYPEEHNLELIEQAIKGEVK